MNTTKNLGLSGWLKLVGMLLGIFLVILLAQKFSPSSDRRISSNRGISLENPVAQYYQGVVYHQGKEVPKDDKEAVRWWKKAAKQGHTQSQFSLYILYNSGGKGVAKDQREAKRWLKKAAALGHADARTMLLLTNMAKAEAEAKAGRR